MTDEDLFDEIAFDVSRAMATIVQRHQRHPGMIAEALTDSLGAFISIFSLVPEKTIEACANRLKMTDVAQIRLRHFGHKLQVAQDIEKPTPGAIITGVSHNKPE